MNQFESSRRNGVAAVIGGVLIHLTLGNLYSFGNLMTYLASYLRHVVDPSVTYSSVVWVMAITTGAQGLFMVLGGLLERKIGPRLTCALGCLIMSAGVGFTYFSVKISLGCVIFTYGFLVGLGISLSYVCPMACAMKWFPNKKGIINGFVVGGFGLGALGSTTFQTRYLNPQNVSVGPSGYFEDEQILARVPGVFLAMGGIFLCMQTVGCFLLCQPSYAQPLLQSEEGDLDDDDELQLHRLKDSCRLSLSPTQMLRTGLFYHLWLLYLLCTIIIGYINATYKSFGQTFLRDDYMLSLVGSVAAIFNASGRICWGKLMDYTSFRTAMSCVTISLCALFLALTLTPHSPYPAFAYTAAIWLIFFTFSGTFVLMPTVTEKVFGSRYYASNYGLFFTSQVFSGVLVATLNHMMLDALGYTGCYISVAGIAAVGFLLTCLIPRQV